MYISFEKRFCWFCFELNWFKWRLFLTHITAWGTTIQFSFSIFLTKSEFDKGAVISGFISINSHPALKVAFRHKKVFISCFKSITFYFRSSPIQSASLFFPNHPFFRWSPFFTSKLSFLFCFTHHRPILPFSTLPATIPYAISLLIFLPINSSHITTTPPWGPKTSPLSCCDPFQLLYPFSWFHLEFFSLLFNTFQTLLSLPSRHKVSFVLKVSARLLSDHQALNKT